MGWSNDAAVPVPSAYVLEPDPARVVTMPEFVGNGVGVIVTVNVLVGDKVDVQVRVLVVVGLLVIVAVNVIVGV